MFNIGLGKTARIVAQVMVFAAVIILGMIAISGVINAYYFQPDNLFINLFPAFSETLMDAWNTGVTVILVLQSLFVLAIGLIFLVLNWQSIRGGKATFRTELTLMILTVILHLAAILLLFRAASLAGGSSPVGFWVPTVVTTAGVVQASFAMLLFGPHYNML